MAEIRFRRCHGPYFFAENPCKRERKSCPKDGQQNVKGRIRHWGCHRPCGHAQDGLEKNVHIRTFFQKDRILKISVICPFLFEKRLLIHVWAGIRVKILLQAGLRRIFTFRHWYHYNDIYSLMSTATKNVHTNQTNS